MSEPLTYKEHACLCGRRCWGPDTSIYDKVDMRPMTDYDLEAYDEGAMTGQHRFVERPVIRRLVAEIRRLRSDEWLEKAAEEIAADERVCDEAQAPETVRDIALAILRKHRDG